jgi:hypothetical protein
MTESRSKLEALLTSRVSGPKGFAAAAISLPRWARLARSAFTAAASPPAARMRATVACAFSAEAR